MGSVRVAVHLKAIEGAAEQAGRLPRKLYHVVEGVGQGDVRQQVGALDPERSPRPSRGSAGHAGRRRGVLGRLPRGCAGQRLDRRGVVVAHRMVQAAHDRQAIYEAARARQVLTDADTRHHCGDRTILAAHLGGRVRLGIERVEVARPPVEEQEDTGADAPRGATAGCSAEAATWGGPRESAAAAVARNCLRLRVCWRFIIASLAKMESSSPFSGSASIFFQLWDV